MNISVVIPTWNREDLVEKLLESLYEARKCFKYGDTEVIVVDSSEGEAKEQIVSSCQTYHVRYIEGPQSVRKKRNIGIDEAKYEVIHFIDSDVTVDSDILNVHAETFLNGTEEKLAGSFGYTEFVGEKSFWWHIAEQTTYLDSFHFAEMFPYQSWTIGNNVAFYKDVLLKCGKFKEDLPFKLGGDDLEFTYRITKSGYLIKSAPNARCFHSTKTWNHHNAIQNRTKRWGSMEYYIKTMHPELFVNCIIKSDLRFAMLFVVQLILSASLLSWVPLIGWLLWILLYSICIYFVESKQKGFSNPFFVLLGKYFKEKYHLYFIIESLKHSDFTCLYQEMTFSTGQTMHMYKEASNKLWLWLCSGAVSLIAISFIK